MLILRNVGWSSACEPASGSGPNPIAGPTTGVQCCPSYVCSPISSPVPADNPAFSDLKCSGLNWCVQDPTPTVRPVWSLYTDKYGIEGVLTSAAFPTNKVFAKPIFVAYQSSDRDVLAAATQAAASNGSLQPTAKSSSETSLSGGTIAGIAIGSAAGGILIATILTFVFLRFCLGYRRTQNKSKKGEAEHGLDSSVRGLSPRQQDVRHHWKWSATELDSAGNTRTELPLSGHHTINDRVELADHKDSRL